MRIGPHPFGIARTVTLPLLVFLCTFLLWAGVLLLAFRGISDTVEESAERKIPALTSAATLIRECEQIRGLSF